LVLPLALKSPHLLNIISYCLTNGVLFTMQIGGLAILKNRHNCVKAQRTMQHRHHIGADLVIIAKKNISENNTKLCPVMQMDRLLYYKSFNRVWQGSKIGK